ncbi:hypothetical protein CDEST_14859 [Colletotrichum destructivum]|uniref:Transposase n=1 Tax=Colletotrichum destructivum TaxID=34406 RepID=A0AAX4J326_9PEZI|nr:hypothetical protein CDEST_14859 [Colletotrichum destructivum]
MKVLSEHHKAASKFFRGTFRSNNVVVQNQRRSWKTSTAAYCSKFLCSNSLIEQFYNKRFLFSTLSSLDSLGLGNNNLLTHKVVKHSQDVKFQETADSVIKTTISNNGIHIYILLSQTALIISNMKRSCDCPHCQSLIKSSYFPSAVSEYTPLSDGDTEPEVVERDVEVGH